MNLLTLPEYWNSKVQVQGSLSLQKQTLSTLCCSSHDQPITLLTIVIHISASFRRIQPGQSSIQSDDLDDRCIRKQDLDSCSSCPTYKVSVDSTLFDC